MTPHPTLPTTELTENEIFSFWKSAGIVLHLGKTSPHFYLLTDLKYFSSTDLHTNPYYPETARFVKAVLVRAENKTWSNIKWRAWTFLYWLQEVLDGVHLETAHWEGFLYYPPLPEEDKNILKIMTFFQFEQNVWSSALDQKEKLYFLYRS